MIAVTGATGKVGRELVAELRKAGAEFKAVARDPAKASAALGGAQAAPGDLSKPETLLTALRGAEAAFLLPPSDPRQPDWERGFADAAKSAGVKRVVKLSVAGAAPDAGTAFARWHHAGEEALKTSGLAWTMLRPVFFHQNFLLMTESIRAGAFYLPAGDAVCAFVDTRDIAAAAAAALLGPGHEGKTYVLSTGVHTYAQAAQELSKAAGREIRYVDVAPSEARKSMLGSGMPVWYADALLELYALVRAGHISRTSPDFEQVTRRKPISLARFSQDYAAEFRPKAAKR